MRFMLLLYANEKAGAEIPPDQMAKAMDTLYAYQAALEKAGAFVDTHALARTWDARTVRMEGGDVVRAEDGSFVNHGGKLAVHDGPYADTREQLGGFYIIEASDMDAALEWAKRCPAAQWGPIEVRQFVEL